LCPFRLESSGEINDLPLEGEMSRSDRGGKPSAQTEAAMWRNTP